MSSIYEKIFILTGLTGTGIVSLYITFKDTFKNTSNANVNILKRI